jgi:ELWxxDGT repeat protein
LRRYWSLAISLSIPIFLVFYQNCSRRGFVSLESSLNSKAAGEPSPVPVGLDSKPSAPRKIDVPRASVSIKRLSIEPLSYFVASDSMHGAELWRSDGTPAGTFMLRDLNEGADPSNPDNMINLNGTLFFTATDAQHGTELWKSDGTTHGTVRVRDIVTGPLGSSPRNLTVYGSKLAFIVSNALEHNVEELWITDGTEAGTNFVFPLSYYDARYGGIGGPTGLKENFLVIMDGSLWTFGATSAASSGKKFSIIKSNGTTQGTSVATPEFEMRFGGHWLKANITSKKLYFDYGKETPSPNGYGVIFDTHSAVWVSDGTIAGTTQAYSDSLSLKHFPTTSVIFDQGLIFSNVNGAAQGGECVLHFLDGLGGIRSLLTSKQCVSQPIAMGNAVYFLRANTDINTIPLELWKTDGTTSGTLKIKGFNAGAFGINTNSVFLAANSKRLVFLADDGVTGLEPWISDGTVAGTKILRDFNPGLKSSNIGEYFEYGSDVFLNHISSTQGAELWKVSSTGELVNLSGELSAADRPLWPGNFLNLGNKIIFTAFNPQTNISNFYSTDRNHLTFSVISDIATTPLQNPGWQGAALNSKAYFIGAPGSKGISLYSSAGTTASTIKVDDILPAGGCLDLPSEMRAINGKILFDAASLSGRDMWLSDGKLGGTNIFRSSSTNPVNYNSSNPKLSSLPVFTFDSQIMIFPSLAFEGINPLGNELWSSDGTAAGTRLLKDINPGENGSIPGDFVRLGNTALFSAYTQTSGKELWQSDGTPTGTKILKEIYPGLNSAFTMFKAVELNQVLIFPATADGSIYRLWATDGTEAGTRVLISNLEIREPEKFEVVKYNGRIYFSATNVSNKMGQELYSSDGTEAGTTLVKDILPGPLSSDPTDFILVKDRLVFWAVDSESGREPWVTDGTTENTRRIGDLTPDSWSSNPSTLKYVYNDLLFFSVINSGNGNCDLWRFDSKSKAIQKLRSFSQTNISLVLGQAKNYLYFMTSNNDLWTLNLTTDEVLQVNLPAELTFLLKVADSFYFTSPSGDLYVTP